MRPAAAFTALALLGGCATAVPEGPITGEWGGEHVGLTLDPVGGRLEYDCAAGTIVGPVIAARDGSFAANGTHTPGLGGPERIGYVPPSYPARYAGTVRRKTKTLRVSVPARDIEMGPFRLRRGADPRILRCL